MIPFSVLDLVPIVEGSGTAEALANSMRLARHAESLGFRRYWVAEHHNMPGVASAATAVVIGHLAGGTSRIRVGAGGIMLPNHAPLVIAEQFGTLASLYPGRIDLGLGRAPGTDAQTTRALRRDQAEVDRFPQEVEELRGYFDAGASRQPIRAIPALDVELPFWLLGSSVYSAQLAALLGLPFAFAAHFSPDWLMPALQLYRQQFSASAASARPHAMVCVNLVMADSDQAAQRLFTSHQQAFMQLRRGRPGKLPPPVDDMERYWSPEERAMAEHAMRCSFVGSPASVEAQLTQFLQATRPDELMVHVLVHDQAARMHSLTLTAQLRDRLAPQAA
ncbi:MAG TPA: LLM class flavin-dependent oxidoreductase [Steroidobacteraceae bacterium]|jgi:luciferase family oxidoreductase group 1|nr:LLM class flavin-dependent oxidoreductase [Steroidobacteraceae bacterium]